jgi:fatty-acyl-CoA synthase
MSETKAPRACESIQGAALQGTAPSSYERQIADDWGAIGHCPAAAARKWGTREALVFGSRRYTFRDFDHEVDRVAAALIGAGVAMGEKVAIWLSNCPEYLFLVFAIIKVGAVAVPLNIRYRSRDLAYALRQSKSAMLVTTAQSGPVDLDAILGEVLGEDGGLAGFPNLRSIVYLQPGSRVAAMAWPEFVSGGGRISAEQVRARAAQVAVTDAAFILYTSGTTGAAKGVLLDHTAVRGWSEKALAMGMTVNDAQINYMPLFHVYSLSWIVGQCVVTGARQVLMEHFDPRTALELISRERVTIAHGFDTHWRDLLEELGKGEYDISSLRVSVFISGLESTVALAEEVQRRVGRTVGAYGMTETWAGVTLTPLDASIDQRCRASGYPLPGVEIRIVDPETGEDCGVEEQGEILVRGPALARGYFEMPDASARMYDGQGWYHTGDAGLLRADGHLRFVGRYKDMLKIGGENLAPAEIESLLLEHPMIVQAAVVGMPDDRLREVAAAFVVCRDGQVVSEGDLAAFCAGKLASFKVPRRVVLVDELPVTASGKVRKDQLREKLGEILKAV